MDYLSLIKAPIASELDEFITLFNQSLEHEDGLLATALNHIKQRCGKRMRPILILLIAKSFWSCNARGAGCCDLFGIAAYGQFGAR